MTSQVAAIIPAAGQGLRLGAESGTPVPKALRVIAGRSLLARSVAALSPVVDEVVVAAPADHLAAVRQELTDCAVPVQVVAGGGSRQASVRRALAAVAPSAEFIVVHDAARPLVPPDVTARVISALRDGAAVVVPAIPLADSLRQVFPGGSEPVDRSGLRAVQTPQGFRKDLLVEAHRATPDGAATDDASLVERTGAPVTLVEGAALAFKITTPIDLLLAELLLSGRARTSAAPQR